MARPRRLNPGTALIGALVGGSLGGGGTAAIGGIVGSALGATPSLGEAITDYLRAAGMELVSLRRTRKSALSIVFRNAISYWSIEVSISEQPRTPDDLDDALYDAAVRDIENWRGSHR